MSTLYHYTSYDALLKIIATKTIWASNIHYLNDGSEFEYAVKALESVLKEGREPVAGDLREAVMARLRRDRRSEVFVASFSMNGDLLSQWRGYCPPSQGVSVGFSRKSIDEICWRQGFRLRNCVYDIKQQRHILDDLAIDLLEDYDKRDRGDPEMQKAMVRFLPKFLREAPCFKDPAFTEEQEVRLVPHDENPFDETRVKYRQGRSFIIPYLEFSLPMVDDRLNFEEVVIGPTPHAQLAEDSLSRLLHANHVSCGKITVSRAPYRTW